MASSQPNNSNTGNTAGGANRQANPRGSFANGQWYCECVPPLPVNRFQVTSKQAQPENIGRWFYRCPKRHPNKPEQGCNLFLWEDEVRERAGLPPTPTAPPRPSTPPHNNDSHYAPRDTGSASRKRTRPAGADTGELPDIDAESTGTAYGVLSEDNSEIDRGLKRVVHRDYRDNRHVAFSSPQQSDWYPRSPPATQPAPRYIERRESMPQSSTQPPLASRLPPTPETGRPNPSSARNSTAGPLGPMSALDYEQPEPDSPSAIRYGKMRATATGRLAPPPEMMPLSAGQGPSFSPQDVNSSPYAANHGKSVAEAVTTLTSEILAIFDDHVQLTTEARGRLQDSLGTFRKHVTGVELGRDATRTALRNKDEKIEALSSKVQRLEQTLEAETPEAGSRIDELQKQIDVLKQALSRSRQRENGESAQSARGRQQGGG